MLNENDLIKGCQEFNINAQEALYKLYARKMNAVCFYYTGSEADAEDVLHEGFIKVFDKIRQYKGEGSFEGWMRRLIVNVAIDFLKKKKKRLDKVADFTIEVTDDNFSDIEEIQEEENEIYFTNDELIEAIGKLKDEYRLIFNMFCLENYSHKEISEILSIKEDTCRSKLRRAKNILRQYLKELKTEKLKDIKN
jgi:RNA polymerase sigma-70 factor (ECF subfamily)